jgi:Tol biopolymer transport system component
MELGFVRGPSIFLSATDGTHPHRVLRGRGNTSYFEPAWSRDGRLSATREIYGQGGSGHAEDDVIVLRGHQTPVVLDILSASPTWAPDGKRIAFISNSDMFGGSLYVGGIGRHSTPLQQGDHNDAPAWSPDGKKIAFGGSVFSPFTDEYITSYVYVIGAKGGQARQVTPTSAWNPSWSPDSRRIVFDDDHRIRVINVDGSGPKTLFTARHGDHASNPAWSPDGHLIAFDYGNGIWTMSPNGSRPHLVIPNARDPAWKRG